MDGIVFIQMRDWRRRRSLTQGPTHISGVTQEGGGSIRWAKAERWAWSGKSDLYLPLLCKVGLMFKLAEHSDIKDCPSGPRIVFHFILMVMFCLK